MPDDPTPTLPAEVSADIPAEVTPPTETPATPPEPPDWRALIEHVPAEELRKHGRISGIAGELAQRQVVLERERMAREESEKTQKAERERLRDLAQQDPVTFAEQYLSAEEKREILSNQQSLRARAREEMATMIGRAFTDLPEWDLSTEELQSLVEAVTGRPEDEVIPAYNKQAVQILAKKIAAKEVERFKKAELAREREAIRAEESAKILGNGRRPDLVPPRSAPLNDEPDWETNPKAWNTWYDRRYAKS